MTLEDAQRAKLHYVCRKLWLRPGETVVEVGGGWGALALLLARDYGVTVKSFNISRSQIAWARRRAKAEGLDSRVEFVEDDYRNITGRFDALVSLGMLEHVAPALPRVRPHDGPLPWPHGPRIDPVDRAGPTDKHQPLDRCRIFPGAYPPTLREMTDLFEPWGFSVLDVENLRLHYAQTLRHWLHVRGVGRPGGRDVRRAFRVGLAGSTWPAPGAAFAGGAATVPGRLRAAGRETTFRRLYARLYA